MLMKRRNNFKKFLRKAQQKHFGIGAFNFSTAEQLKAIFEAAHKLQSPIIIETSMGESKFLGLDVAPRLVQIFKKKYGVPALLNLDHGKEVSCVKEAIRQGYDMVHFDGSLLPYEENLTKTAEVVSYAHKHGVVVEGELGHLQGSSRLHEETPFVSLQDLTDPQQAQDFVRRTKVDFLAISVGNIHGIFQGGKANPALKISLVHQINQLTGGVFLSLHGGSGIKKQDIQAAIQAGIVKININTELRLAYSSALKEALQKNPSEIVPYHYLPFAMQKCQEAVEAKIGIFGSAHKI